MIIQKFSFSSVFKWEWRQLYLDQNICSICQGNLDEACNECIFPGVLCFLGIFFMT